MIYTIALHDNNKGDFLLRERCNHINDREMMICAVIYFSTCSKVHCFGYLLVMQNIDNDRLFY